MPLQMKLVTALSIILLKRLVDRQEAIKAANGYHKPAELDAVIIAGKGADCYQIIQGKKESYPGDKQLSQKIIYKNRKSRENETLDFFLFFSKTFFKPSTAPSTAPFALSLQRLLVFSNCFFNSSFKFCLMPQ